MDIPELKEQVEELEGRERKLYETSIFVSKMVLAGLIFQLVLFTYPDTYGLQAGLAHVTQILLELFGVELERQGALLVDSRKSYLVTQDCLGWKSMAAFTALLFSSTSEYRRHLKPFIAGIIVIGSVNIIRVSTTVYLSQAGLISFEIIHSLFWKWGLTFTVIVLWLFWLYNDPRKPEKESLNNTS